MRQRRLRKLIKRLRELQHQDLTRDDLLLKLGAAKKEAGKAYGLLIINTPTKDQPVTPQTFHFQAGSQETARRTPARGQLFAALQHHGRRSRQISGGSICNWSRSTSTRHGDCRKSRVGGFALTLGSRARRNGRGVARAALVWRLSPRPR